jgi:antitoxin component YwqK of YwqJK toxin-antitoxin module
MSPTLPRALIAASASLAFWSCAALSSSGNAAPASQAQAGLHIDTVQTFFPSGRLQERYEAYRNKRGDRVFHGLSQMWNDSGVMVLEYQAKNGKRNGVYRTWFASGRPETEAHYVNDLEEGTQTWWYESGQKSRDENYKAGAKDGPAFLYYENGKFKYEGAYLAGKEHGKYRKYFQNGDMQAEGEYDNGKLLYEKTEFKK